MADFLYVTLERAAQIFRAMNGDEEAQKVTTFLDIAGLVNAPDFGRFLLWNKAHLEVAECGQLELAVVGRASPQENHSEHKHHIR